MVGPSASGSEKGTPISTTSAPASRYASPTSRAPSSVGYPAVRYGMSAVPPSGKAARSLSPPCPLASLVVTRDLFRLVGVHAQGLGDDPDVLVAAAGEVHDEVLARPQLFRQLLGVEEGVGRLKRRDDALQAGAVHKAPERL